MSTSLLRVPEAPGLSPHESRAPGVACECTVPLRRYDRGGLTQRHDAIAVEADLHVHVGDQPDAVLSRTPGDDLNLVMGHLFCNSLVKTPEEVADIDFSYRGTARANVRLDRDRALPRIFPKRPPVILEPERLFELKETFERRQNLFRNTGATHAAALFSLQGRLLAFGEDVGRHNAFDKAIGRALLEGTLARTAIAMISSRIAVELAVKASRADIPVLCGFSAATSSGVDYAEAHGITLVGRLKKRSFDVYANAWRLEDKAPQA